MSIVPDAPAAGSGRSLHIEDPGLLTEVMIRDKYAMHTKMDEFSEKFQTTFDPPPPHFRKIMLRILSRIHDRSTPLQWQKSAT